MNKQEITNVEAARNFLYLLRHPLERTKTIYHKLRVERNELCSCGSGMKFKKCCLPKIQQPLTRLAKKEFDKERRGLMRSIKKQYKEKVNEES